MKIYIVERHIRYEGSDVVGVYAGDDGLELAKRHQFKGSGDRATISEYLAMSASSAADFILYWEVEREFGAFGERDQISPDEWVKGEA